jgi:hypothetical protein
MPSSFFENYESPSLLGPGSISYVLKTKRLSSDRSTSKVNDGQRSQMPIWISSTTFTPILYKCSEVFLSDLLLKCEDDGHLRLNSLALLFAPSSKGATIH